ncbi:MAG: permease prefix domain 1-containing protein [Chloroflexota bacterium]
MADDIPAPSLRDRYLDRVRAQLRLPDDISLSVVDELSAHIADSTEGLVAEGLTAEQAEREALARLGSPDELGANLRASEQTLRRALAAAGGGALVAARQGLIGLVMGYATAMIAVVGGGLLVTAFQPDPDRWPALARAGAAVGTIFGAMVWAVAVHFAARAGTRRFARTSRRALSDVRRPAALFAAGAVVAVLLVLPLVLDLPAVAAVAFVPVSAAFGALRATEWDEPRGRRRVALLAGIAVLGAVVLPLVVLFLPPVTSAPATSGFDSIEVGRDAENLYAPIGRFAADEMSLIDAGTTFLGDGGRVTIRTYVSTELDGWSDVRLEAWLADTDSFVPAKSAKGPIASAIPTTAGNILTAEVDVSKLRNVGPYLVALVGTDPAGRRTIISGPASREGTFSGTVVQWLFSPSAR